MTERNKKHELDKIKAEFAQGEPSDHLMFANMSHQWEMAYHSGTNIQFSAINCLNEKSLAENYQIKEQVVKRLENIDILGNKKDLDQNSNNLYLIKAILVSFPPKGAVLISRKGVGLNHKI